MDRSKERRNFIIPIVLTDEKTQLSFKAVVLDVASTGLKVFSNDKRLLLVDESVLKAKVFDLDFDFFDLPTNDIKAQVVNITTGEHSKFERRFGLQFVDFPAERSRNIEEFLQEYHD
jgi:c-di-GMP-binding flagellar brake protein YcgR